jgi:hypothetical protein
MSITNERIVESCIGLLEAVQRHPHGINERPFLTAYQILILLREAGNQICQELEHEYGPAVGKGGGENVGRAQRIAQALGHSNRIETHYLDTRRITFAGIEPSGWPDCGIFRMKE